MAFKDKATMQELFEKHAKRKAEAMRVYSRVKDKDIMNLSINELLSIPEIGVNAVKLVVDVVADMRPKR